MLNLPEIYFIQPIMEDLNKIVGDEKTTANQKDSKKETTKPTVVKKDKTENKKPAGPHETPIATDDVDNIAAETDPEIVIVEAEDGKTAKSDNKNSRKAAKKQKTEGKIEVPDDAATKETQEKAEPDKKPKEKIKVIKKNAKKAEGKVDKLKKKVKKAKKKEVKPSKLKALKEKLGNALDKLKSSAKKQKKAKK